MLKAGSPDGHHRQAGFTVIELIAVFAVLVIVSGVIISAIPDRRSASNLKAVALQITEKLQDARADAINRQKQNIVIFDAGRHIVNLGHNRQALRLDRDISIRLEMADSERRAARVSGIRFFPNGSSTGGTLLLKRNGQTFEIRVNWLNGRVMLKRLNARNS